MKICILRLSAIGDVCNCIPTLRAIQRQWPEAKITWIVGKTEFSILKDLGGVDFIVFDKSRMLSEWFHLRKLLRREKFDALLHMQASLRASFLSLTVRAKRRIGFDRLRAKDHQTFFTNEKIPERAQAHMLETFLDFAYQLGVSKQEKPEKPEKFKKSEKSDPVWNIPIASYHAALEKLKTKIPLPEKFYVISPCSTKPIRNWNIAGYAETLRQIWEKYQIPALICGGNSELEQQYGSMIAEASSQGMINLVGKTSLIQMMALLEQAKFVIAPDSGPAHMATAVGTPVIGLYANTNPDRARPYNSQQWLVNQYPQAVQKYLHKSADDVPWRTRVRVEGVMDLIIVDQVMHQVDAMMAAISTETIA